MRNKSVAAVIDNELGHSISITITQDPNGVSIFSTGPYTQVEHLWTAMEAATIRDLLLFLRIDESGGGTRK
jgi:hypothetical protein